MVANSLNKPPLPRAQFELVMDTEHVVFIADANRTAAPSVTNDAEAVTKYVYHQFPKRIVYRDSTGEWSELVHERGEFIRFAKYDDWVPGLPEPVTPPEYLAFTKHAEFDEYVERTGIANRLPENWDDLTIAKKKDWLNANL